jgi:hypothetical protein
VRVRLRWASAMRTRNPREGRRRAGLAMLALEAEQDCRLQMYR